MFKLTLSLNGHWIGQLEVYRHRRLHGNTLVYVSTAVDDGEFAPPHKRVFVEHDMADGGYALAQTCLEAHQNGGVGEPVDVPVQTCGACGNTEDLIALEYLLNDPAHYDGVSEWHCKCGARTGRWTGRVLAEGEIEYPFGA